MKNNSLLLMLFLVLIVFALHPFLNNFKNNILPVPTREVLLRSKFKKLAEVLKIEPLGEKQGVMIPKLKLCATPRRWNILASNASLWKNFTETSN